MDENLYPIGSNCMLAPNVAIYTAGHPLHPDSRNSGYEYGMDVTIGNHVWIGGSVVITPGVRIGDCCVIGAGSVVLQNLPANCTAAGVPANVVRINGAKVNPADDLNQQDVPNVLPTKLAELESRIGRLEVADQDLPPVPKKDAP